MGRRRSPRCRRGNSPTRREASTTTTTTIPIQPHTICPSLGSRPRPAKIPNVKIRERPSVRVVVIKVDKNVRQVQVGVVYGFRAYLVHDMQRLTHLCDTPRDEADGEAGAVVRVARGGAAPRAVPVDDGAAVAELPVADPRVYWYGAIGAGGGSGDSAVGEAGNPAWGEGGQGVEGVGKGKGVEVLEGADFLVFWDVGCWVVAIFEGQIFFAYLLNDNLVCGEVDHQLHFALRALSQLLEEGIRVA